MKKYFELLRVKHWIKNLLIFVPLVCSKQLTTSNIIISIIAFLSFSLTTSFVYIINDIRDIEKDKLHERKKLRPLPSGKISKKQAIMIACLLLVVSVITNIYSTDFKFNMSLLIMLSYIIINILYSFGLKDIPVIDIILLASGFVLRIYYGAAIIGVEVSNWLFLTILNGSLFLGLGKRKKEFISNKDSRKVLSYYTKDYLNQFLYLTLSLVLVFYSLWSLEQSSPYIIYTTAFLIVIFMKYCLDIEISDEGDPTTVLYKDKVLLLICTIYVIIMMALMIL